MKQNSAEDSQGTAKQRPLEISISGARREPPIPVPQAPIPAAPAPVMAEPAAAPVPQAAPVEQQPIIVETPQPPSISQQLNADHAEFEKELALGKITPETYHSLYAKKDTLGKIGTLFGLLVSGAGSGLAHQPNAVLDMMTKEIGNDLDAQKASNTNSQNWYQLTQKHEVQKAEIAKMAAESELLRGQAGAIPSQISKTQAETGLLGAQTGAIPSQIEKTKSETGLMKAQTGMIPSQIKKLGAETRGMDIETAIKGNTLAANRATSGAWQSLVDLTNKLPDGAQKERAKQTLGFLYPQYQGLITSRNAQAEGMINYAKMMSGLSDPAASGGQANINSGKFNQLQRMGEAKIPGGMSGQDIGNATKEATDVETIRAMKKSFINSFDALNKMYLAGELQPNVRKAYVNVLGATLAKQSAGRYNENEAAALVDGMFPQVGDWGKTREIKRQKGIEYFDNQEAGTPTLNRFGLKNTDSNDAAPTPSGSGRSGGKPQSKPVSKPAKKSDGGSFQLKEGATGVDKRNGKPVTYHNGKWVYKK